MHCHRNSDQSQSSRIRFYIFFLLAKRIVGVAEKRARPAVAALGHMVRMAGNDDAGEASHAA
jgi:hypothetical protein